MSEFLYNILNSQVFAPLVIVWLIICLANQRARNSFIMRLSVLISKPIIFREDERPDEYAFYPRRILEQSSMVFQNAFTHPLYDVISQFTAWTKLQISLAYRRETPTRVVGYFIYLMFFILFAWANAIGIITSLDILRLFQGDIPALLTSFEVAVFMSTLGSGVVAGLVLMDIESPRSVLSNWSEHETNWKRIAKIISMLSIFFAVMIVMALGLQRLATIGYANQDESLMLVTNFAILALVPINNVLSIVLISYEAILGILVVLVAIQMPLLGVMYVLDYITTILGTVLPFLLDILYRFALLVVDLLFYVILTPIDTLIGAPIRIIEQRTRRQ